MGLRKLAANGCTTCHVGPLVGGTLYQKLGLVKPWPNQKDQGRYDLTKQETDRMMFKVPSLRNIEKTGPYFHDGSAATLEQAIEMMAWHQLGLKISSADVADIKAFLESLTGELDPQVAAAGHWGKVGLLNAWQTRLSVALQKGNAACILQAGRVRGSADLGGDSGWEEDIEDLLRDAAAGAGMGVGA